MRINLFLIGLILSHFCLSCKKDIVKAPDPTVATDSLQIKINDSLVKQTQLQSHAQTKAASIKGYSILENGLQELDGMTIAETKTNVEEWVNASLELQIAMLDSLTNRAINSRMTLLRTKTNILKQEVEKQKIDTAVINKEATELYNAFQDLSIQLNREYGSSVDEFLKEFKEESQKLRREAQERRNQSADTVQ